MPSPLTSPAPLDRAARLSRRRRCRRGRSPRCRRRPRRGTGCAARRRRESRSCDRTPRSSRRHRSCRWGRHRRADDEVVDAVAVDVAGAAHRAARVVVGIDAFEDEARAAVAARRREQAAQLEGGRKSARAAEHHVALAGSSLAVGVGTIRADDQVVDAVTVDVAGAAHRTARAIVGIDAFEDEALAAIAARRGMQAAQLESCRKRFREGAGNRRCSSEPRRPHARP